MTAQRLPKIGELLVSTADFCDHAGEFGAHRTVNKKVARSCYMMCEENGRDREQNREQCVRRTGSGQ